MILQYDFRKTVQDPNHGEFQHPNFRQDRPELLPNIKRKAHHKSSESTKKSGGLHLETSDYSGTIFFETLIEIFFHRVSRHRNVASGTIK